MIYTFEMTKSKDKQQDRRIAKLEREIGSAEKKFNYFSNYSTGGLTTIPGVTAASPLQFNFINQGDGPNERIGNKVMVKSLDYKVSTSSTLDSPQRIRFIAFYWNSDAAPVLSDVLQILPSASGIPDPIMMPINQVSVQNKYLQVLADRHLFIEGDVLGQKSRLFQITFRKRYKRGKPQYYTDTSGGDMKTGFYYLLMSEVPASSTTPADSCVTVYTDM